jgi:small subunit ribosomal protein S6
MLYELIAVVRASQSHWNLHLLPANYSPRSGPATSPRSKSTRSPHGLVPRANPACRIARTAGSLILRSGGTIRGIKNWGVFSLPRKMSKHQAQYHDGHHFVMRFDSSSKTQDNLRKTLGLDPRMIKFNTVKLGDGTLESISKIGGRMPWANEEP